MHAFKMPVIKQFIRIPLIYFSIACFLSPQANAIPKLKTKTPATYFSMPCYIVADHENWTFKEFGFSLSYIDSLAQRQQLHIATSGTNAKNCAESTITLKAQIPAGPITIRVQDFQGQLNSTVVCANTMQATLHPFDLGKNCQLLVHSDKLGSFTRSAKCSISLSCSD